MIASLDEIVLTPQEMDAITEEDERRYYSRLRKLEQAERQWSRLLAGKRY